MPHILNLKNKKLEKENSKETDYEIKYEYDRPNKNITPESITKIEWEAHEYNYYEKSLLWFLIYFIISFAILGLAVWFKNWTFVFLIILGASLIYIYALKPPRKIKMRIDARGITVEEKLYFYKDLKSFWIFYDPPHVKYLSLISKKLIVPQIKIPIGKQDPNEIRKMLLKFLPEEEHEESFADILARIIRF